MASINVKAVCLALSLSLYPQRVAAIFASLGVAWLAFVLFA